MKNSLIARANYPDPTEEQKQKFKEATDQIKQILKKFHLETGNIISIELLDTRFWHLHFTHSHFAGWAAENYMELDDDYWQSYQNRLNQSINSKSTGKPGSNSKEKPFSDKDPSTSWYLSSLK